MYTLMVYLGVIFRDTQQKLGDRSFVLGLYLVDHRIRLKCARLEVAQPI